MKEEIKGGLNSWNVFYHSDQNVVDLLSKSDELRD
jgi:hypothetical protein